MNTATAKPLKIRAPRQASGCAFCRQPAKHEFICGLATVYACKQPSCKAQAAERARRHSNG